MKIKISITDDSGKNYEGELELSHTKNGSKLQKSKKTEHNWYSPGTTVEKIVNLVQDGFFDKNRTISDIVEELKY